jgi:acetyltransferase-like isoleucine patch superfamily enzyme
MRRLERYRSYDMSINSLQNYNLVRSRSRVIAHSAIFLIARFIPWFSFKNFLYRLTGMHIGKNVAIGLEAMFGIFHPEKIFIGSNTIIGYNAVILEHEFLVDGYRLGEVHVGKNVLIGARSVILPGIIIGDNSIIAAGSVVTEDVLPNTMVAGNPAKFVKQI